MPYHVNLTLIQTFLITNNYNNNNTSTMARKPAPTNNLNKDQPSLPSDDSKPAAPAKKVESPVKFASPTHNNNHFTGYNNDFASLTTTTESFAVAGQHPITPVPYSITAAPTSIASTALVAPNNVPPDDDLLASFGITASTIPPVRYNNRDSFLRCCIIDAKENSALVFRVEPKDPNSPSGSWGEKQMFDAIRTHEDWTTKLHFDDKFFQWYHENVPQKNPKNYHIRLFVIRVQQVPETQNLFQLARHICKQINASPGNTTTTDFDENHFFWLPDDAVWADIIGIDAALKQLVTATTGLIQDGFFETNRSLINCFFHSGTYSVELARYLHAPMTEIHPLLHAGLETTQNPTEKEFTCDTTTFDDADS
jgi:hypothetical protein